MLARLVSVNVGMPADIPWQGRTVHTGVGKYPVTGPVLARRLNLDGDGQGDLAGHGGEMRAVLVYQQQSYAYWSDFLGRDDLRYGQLGENFTVDGLPDDDVCIGDRYAIGAAEFEVTQPRVTCFRSGLGIGEPRMPALLVSQHRPGFYLRVIREGSVQAGDEIVRTRTGRHRMSVRAVDALLYLPGKDTAGLRAAADIPALSPGWQQSFRELLDAAGNGAAPAAAPAVANRSGWTGFRPLRISRVVAETPTVASLTLRAPDGGALPGPLAGQFLTVRVPGAGTPAPVRTYSLSAAGPEEFRISVKREDGGLVSSYLHTLAAGAELEVAAPRGEFVLRDGSGPVLLISAGIGATPVLAMLHELRRTDTTRDVWWIHTARSPAEQPFREEAHHLLAGLPGGHEHVFYTHPGDAVVAPPATVGRPDEASLGALALPQDADAYLCGPQAFMTAMGAILAGLGLDPARLHTEIFGTLPEITPGIVDTARAAPHPPSGPAGAGPEVVFARSGLTVRWSASYQALLTFAEDCAVPVRWSCRAGVCHTCLTPLLAGRVRYDSEPLDPPADGSVLVCCSRPTSDVVLDL